MAAVATSATARNVDQGSHYDEKINRFILSSKFYLLHPRLTQPHLSTASSRTTPKLPLCTYYSALPRVNLYWCLSCRRWVPRRAVWSTPLSSQS